MNESENQPTLDERHQLGLIMGQIVDQVEHAKPVWRRFLLAMYRGLAEMRETDEQPA